MKNEQEIKKYPKTHDANHYFKSTKARKGNKKKTKTKRDTKSNNLQKHGDHSNQKTNQKKS